MRKTIYLSIYLLFYIQSFVFGQEFSLSLLPRFSYGLTIPPKYQVIQGPSFITTSLKTSYSGNLVRTDGSQFEVEQFPYGLGFDFLMNYSKKNGNSWGLLFGLYQHKYTHSIKYPEFSFKGYNLIEFLSFYQTRGLNLGIRKTIFNNNTHGWYAQLAGMYSFQLQNLNQDNEWKSTIPESFNYVDKGIGLLVSWSDINQNNLTIIPEIGVIMKGDIGVEVSLSYQIPVGNPFGTSQITSYKANNIFGVEKSNTTQESIWLNLRIPLRIWTHHKKQRPQYIPQLPPPVKRLQDVCLTIIDAKTKQVLPNAKVNIEGRVFMTNNYGVVKLYDVPIDKYSNLSVQLLNYESGNFDIIALEQFGCQYMKIELSPNEIRKPEETYEFDGQKIKKGQSIVLNIQFSQSESDLLSEALIELDKVINCMKKYPNLTIELSGHTSNEGDEVENLKLSEDRVVNCKKYIASKFKGSSVRIKAVGYGSSFPRVPNISEQNRRKNRRVELKIDSF